MCTDTEQIYVIFFYIHWYMTVTLNSICVKNNIIIFCYFSNFVYRFYSSNFIIGCHYRYQNSITSYHIF